jgi:putative ABC transport system permease protein
VGVLWHKIVRDLWDNKGRTLQVVLIIGLGAAAIGMILGTRNVVIAGMQRIWVAGHPAMIDIGVSPPVSDDELTVLQHVEGVALIEGENITTIEWRLSPTAEWQQGGLTARVDYTSQKLNWLELVTGQWPHNRTMAVERGSDSFFGIPPTGKIYLRINQQEHEAQLGGVVYNPLSTPAAFGGSAQFYTTRDTFEQWVGTRDFGQLMVTAPRWDETAVAALGDRLQDKLTKQGKVSNRFITNPNKHFFQDQIDGLFMLLTVLATVSLVLGLLLVYNTLSAVITRQVDQIGVLKAVGARTWQILVHFLITVLIYGALALFVAVPLGVLGAWGIASWLVAGFGANPGPFSVSWPALEVMVLITLLAPLLAALVPILSGARITVREAITTYGLNTRVGLLERLGARLRWLSRMMLLTLSNAFRNKWRVMRTQIVLVLSGLIFMMVLSVRDSVVHTVTDVIFSILNADATYVLDHSYRIERVEQAALSYPGVSQVELWALANVKIRPSTRAETKDDISTLLFGVPLPTQMYGYQLRFGRWLMPDDTYGIVLNQKLASDTHLNVHVGDWVTLKYGEKQERSWKVVGLVFDPILTTSSNVPRDVLLRDLHQVDQAGTVWVKTTSQDAAGQVAVAKGLRDYFGQSGIKVSPQRGVFGLGGDATTQTADALIKQFDFIIVLLALMAVIIGVVGSIALSGTLSLSVMERTREIGVMRAIGASSWAVARLFIGEGLLLGWISWLIALPLSLPAGRLMVIVLGQAFRNEYVYQYTPLGALLWLGIITVLSILASWLPARGAVRISVRQSLAYQ